MPAKRNVYLNMKSRGEAKQLFFARFSGYRTGQETIGVRSSGGRVTAAPVFARFSSPSFHSAAMDGIAVLARETFSASDQAPLTLSLEAGQAVMINTGHPMPQDKDAVIMIEDIVMAEDGNTTVIRKPAYPWQHVRKVGEDIVASELLFPTGHQIVPADMAALITAGCSQISVRCRPKLTIIPSGSELIELDDTLSELPAGKTIESNSAALCALAEQAGARVWIEPIIEDDLAGLKNRLLTAVKSDADMVIINAGSSAGSADYTLPAIEELGEVLTHGITIMPGKPTILGIIENKPVVGIPGYPVSAIIAMEEFAVPLLAGMQGITLPASRTIEAVITKDLPSKSGIEEFRRMVVGKIGETYVATPLKKGAGAITTLTRANGMLKIEAGAEGIKGGTKKTIELLAPRSRIDATILCTGSHDLSLNVLGDLLQKNEPSFSLSSSHVGSLGGIIAIKDGMCHMAGSHLLDVNDGSYNVQTIKKYIKGKDLRLITLVYREQGFIVKPGNPKNIHSIASLLENDIKFINRQAGSGTRVLFDYELDRNHLDCDDIDGYDQEEYTHMAVAVAVLSGRADTGLGIKSAAQAMGLGFVPLVEERYDLIIPEAVFGTPAMAHTMELINGREFKQAVEALGGYSTRETGNEVSLGPQIL